MSSSAQSLPARQEMLRSARPALIPLALALVAGALLFREEGAAAVQVWTESTAYNHAFLVLPIALWLAWERRGALARIPLRPIPWAALAVLPFGLAWFAAERMGIMEGRQLAAMGMLEVLFLAVLGWRLWRAFIAPLLYLFFLVPFGAFITPTLQVFTTAFVQHGLDLLGVPNFIDQFTIQIPGGEFYVAEACAGLRFLIAAIVFGVLYACVMYRNPWRRLAFIVASMVTPVVANGFRALGIVLLGYLLGSAQAAETDHILYGWLFFSLVLLVLILAGLPFRQDFDGTASAETALPPPARPARGAAFAAAALTLVLALCGPAAASLLERHAAMQKVSAGAVLQAPPGCTASPAAAQANGILARRFACPGGSLTATVQVFPPRSNPSRIFDALRQVSHESDTSDMEVATLRVEGTEPRDWHMVVAETPPRVTAAAAWIDGHPMTGGIEGRMRQAWNSIVGGAGAPILVAVAVRPQMVPMSVPERQRVVQSIHSFLAHQPDLGARVAALSHANATPR